MIKSNIKKIENDLEDIVKLFFSTNYKKVDINHAYINEGGFGVNFFYLYGVKYYAIHNFAEYYANIDEVTVMKRAAKADLYNILVNITGRISPWGNITGIRPVKFYKDIKFQFNNGKAFIKSMQNIKEKSVKTYSHDGLFLNSNSAILDNDVQSSEFVDKYFLYFLKVLPGKLDLIKKTYLIQSKIVQATTNDCGIYIGIPFCNGKCRYCSFVSADINKCGNLVEPYINALIKEIEALQNIISKNNYNIRSIYIGGGTPSSLELKFIEKILKNVKNLTKNRQHLEYTFEAGRPDSINKNLLKLLKKYKVNRISINPQSANDKTLELIGRGHKFEDVKRAFKLAKDFEFLINADIIASLEGEDLADFKSTVTEVLKLNPDNITVHTLCLKRGSDLKNVLLKTNLISKKYENSEKLNKSEFSDTVREFKNKEAGNYSDLNLFNLEKIEHNIYEENSMMINGYGFKDINLQTIEDCFNIDNLNQNFETYKQARINLKNILDNISVQATENTYPKASKMLEYAQNKLVSKGFTPYYIYRQKYSAGNLENVGYCRGENICLYNIDNMDDTVPILACGANGITKYVANDKIERYANPKDIKTYTEKIDEIIINKIKLFDGQ